MIDGQTIPDFLASLDDRVKITQQEVLKLVQIFDMRVKTLIKSIIMDRNSPFKANYYNYRVEFQARGHPHIHGVLFCDTKQIEDELNLKDLHDTLEKLRMTRTLSVTEKKLVASFIDNFTVCSMTNDIKDTVREVQWHRHTKRKCQKKGSCKYGFPRFPTEYTIISTKLPDNMDKTEKKEKYDKARKIKDKVYDSLSKYDTMKKDIFLEEVKSLTLKDVLGDIGISVEDYYEALSTDPHQIKIHLKREISETYINNYNYEILSAWNANIDFSFCPTFFEIITYITDYMMKDESGMTKHLLQAFKQCMAAGNGSNMHKVLVQCFTTHREMGLPEVFYRIIPALHLSQSNIDCIFLKTGYPKNRMVFLKKVNDEDYPDLDHIEVPGRTGTFVESSDVHDKYINRPTALENMTYCQFGSLFTSGDKSKYKDKTFEDGCFGKTEEHKLITEMGKTDELPKVIRLMHNKAVLVCRKGPPLVVRFHDSSKGNYEEYIYSELLLYHPHRNEEKDLFLSDVKKRLELFLAKRNPQDELTIIEKRKHNIFPLWKDVEEGRKKADELRSELSLISANEEPDSEILEDDEYIFRNPTDDLDELEKNIDEYPGNQSSKRNEKILYQTIVIPELKELKTKVRALHPEQRLVFDKCYKFAIDIKKARKIPTPRYVEPPRLIVHGGAGCGKSFLIETLSMWFEYTLKEKGDSPDFPYVLKCAFSGTAAKNIGGSTIHSTFKLIYTNKYETLNAETKDKMIKCFQNVRVLILDEFSLLTPDILYCLNMRLQELKRDPDHFFGGVAVILLGDIMQLRPVKGRYIFEQPSEMYRLLHSTHDLWLLFEVIELYHNHRQEDDLEFGNLLARVRFMNYEGIEGNQQFNKGRHTSDYCNCGGA